MSGRPCSGEDKLRSTFTVSKNDLMVRKIHTKCCHVLVPRAEEEHVHRDLCTRAFNSESLVERRRGLKQPRFLRESSDKKSLNAQR